MKKKDTNPEQSEDEEGSEMVDAVLLNDDGTRIPIQVERKFLKMVEARNREVQREIWRFEKEERRHIHHPINIENLSSEPEDTSSEQATDDTEEPYYRRHFRGQRLKVYKLCFQQKLKTSEVARILRRSPKTISNLKAEIKKKIEKIDSFQESRKKKN